MAIRALGVTNVALTVILGAVLAVGCGDDDSNTPDEGDAGGETDGGKGGQNTGGTKAGSSGSTNGGGGTNAGGKGGSGGTAGKGQGGEIPSEAGTGGEEPTVSGGAGGEGPGPIDGGGAGGEGGGETDPEPLPVISKLGSKIYTQASDLRGLFYTESGKLYASRDEGESWSLVSGGLPPVVCVKAAVVA